MYRRKYNRLDGWNVLIYKDKYIETVWSLSAKVGLINILGCIEYYSSFS